MNPPKKLGLALSGGGHRATVFSLGALLYLVDSGCNRNVQAISSVSGGSITNAFLATLSRPFSEQTPEEFEREVARFAKQIAGSPRWLQVSIASYLVLIVSWTTLVFLDFPTNLLSPFQLLFLAALVAWAAFVGPRSGGTVWGWWGTWAYIGFLVPAFLIAFSFAWLFGSLLLCLLSALALAFLASLRNKVADFALDATINPSSSLHRLVGSRRKLVHLPTNVRHVFCATEVHTGRHAYFSHDFLYVPFAGIATPAGIRLSTVVQASANFPGGFPLRFLRRRQRFIGDKRLAGPDKRAITMWVIALTDGGVYDNTGSSWFLEADDRPDGAHNIDIWDEHLLGKEPEEDRRRVLAQLRAMKSQPEQLIVVNSSAAVDWRSIKRSFIPLIGEAAQFLAVTDILYGTRGQVQSMDLFRRFISKEYRKHRQGAIVSIAEHPTLLPMWLTVSQNERDRLREVYPVDVEVDWSLSVRAKKVRVSESYGLDFEQRKRDYRVERRTIVRRLRIVKAEWSATNEKATPGLVEAAQHNLKVLELEHELSKCRNRFRFELLDRLERVYSMTGLPWVAAKNRYVSTTFRPLGRDVTARLMWHGYFQTMINATLLLDGCRLMQPFPPNMDDFATLASGVERQARPRPQDA
jgi:predicted acylesterase/phospholipase RssA